VARRPDLAQTFVSLSLRGDLPPEEALLLREWLKAAWQNELKDETVSSDSSACAGQFLCRAGPAASAPLLLSSLLRVLAAPGQAAFYQMRAGALLLGAEWDRSSADWKLNTGARALRIESTEAARQKSVTPPDDAALLAFIERSSGSAKLAGLSPGMLEKQLARALRESSVIAAGPTLGPSDVRRAQLEWKGAPSKEAPPLRFTAAPNIPLRLLKYTADLTQAALVFEFEPRSARLPVEKALALLVLRWKKRGNEGARVYVQPAGGLYLRPAIRVDGPHEQVLGALGELSEEYDRLISAFGAPSHKEWEAAALKRPALEHFEPRCAELRDAELRDQEPLGTAPLGTAPAPDQGAGAQEVDLARQALRAAGSPTVVIWGTDAAPELAE
jgi:hypothetical protein